MVNAVLRRGKSGVVAKLHQNGNITDAEKVDVVCIGSMFKSWELLKVSFIDTTRQIAASGQEQRLNRLLYVNDSSAIGAARYAADDRARVSLPLCNNITILHNFCG